MSQENSGPGRTEPRTSESDAAGAAGAASVLSDVTRLRRQARAARHAYWLPLVLFGALICASTPFYLDGLWSATGGGPVTGSILGPTEPEFAAVLRPGWQQYVAYYWLAAIAGGLALTYLWYRRRGRQVGLVTPARGFLATGAAICLLALVMPAVGLLPGDLTIRGTLPFLIIAAALWVLAGAERSAALAVVVAVYTALALLANLYNIENVLFRLGWNPAGDLAITSLPNILLPGLVLLVAGAVAWRTQRRPRSLA